VRFIILAAISIVLVATFASADSWFFAPKVTTKTHNFGDIKIVLERDATQNQRYPDHILRIYSQQVLLAMYRNVAFQTIYASKDKNFFVGLSNDGIPGTAFVIFDCHGNLIREVKHRYLNSSIYTVMTISRGRVWYDLKDPSVQFESEGRQLKDVTVKGSNGMTYHLLQKELGVNPDDVWAATWKARMAQER
jgi:hypothetical protein